MGEALTIRAPGAPTQTYEEYYGLTQSPFSLAPDPHFLYLSESHEEAIRQLLDQQDDTQARLAALLDARHGFDARRELSMLRYKLRVLEDLVERHGSLP